MTGQRDEKSNIDEEDPTKQAFFSDLKEMEEIVASEAYDLVEHALSLIEVKDYDDSIEILKQAIGLYQQINRIDEINALNNKITQIYLIKEREFHEEESEKSLIVGEEKQGILIERAQKQLGDFNQLIDNAEKFIKGENYEKALDLYDEAIKVAKALNKEDLVNNVNLLIEACYNKKAEFLRKNKLVEDTSSISTQPEIDQAKSEEDLRSKRIKDFQEAKIREEEISNQAFEIIGRASDFAKVYQYDQALELFAEGLELFQQINWTNEVARIQNTIDSLQKEKEEYLRQLEVKRLEQEKAKKLQEQRTEALIKSEKMKKDREQQAQSIRIQQMEVKKEEEEAFKRQISEKVNHAERLAREYEINVKKSLKRGNLPESSVFPEVIKIYTELRNLMVEKGWEYEAEIYSNQILLYQEKHNQDQKLRLIESQKAQKQKVLEESYKLKQKSEDDARSLKKEEIEQKRRQEIEETNIRNEMEKLINSAEKLAREYQISFKKAIKKKKLDFESKYPVVIDLYTKAKEIATQNGWERDAAILTTQIRKYSDEFNKEKRIRLIETQKLEKEILFEESKKSRKESQEQKVDEQKIKQIEEIRQQEVEEANLRIEMEKLAETAERMARDYNIVFKKAIKEKNLEIELKYPEIIGLVNKAREIAINKGWHEDVAILDTHLRKYSDAHAQEKRILELERKKIEKDKLFEESMKVKKESEVLEKRGGPQIDLVSKKQWEQDEEAFKMEITGLVDKAEKMAREYEAELKKSLKKGEIIGSSPYNQIIGIYEDIKDRVLNRGWSDQAAIYENQIKIYEEKLQKDENLRILEAKKIKEQKDFEVFQKIQLDDVRQGMDLEKARLLEEQKVKQREMEEFERYIDQLVNSAEKRAREYDLAIKRGQFEKPCVYPEIIKIYEDIYEKVLAKGWIEEANVYKSQISLYQEKLENDKRLRELEVNKAEKQRLYEESLKVEKDSKTLRIRELQQEDSSKSESEILMDEAFSLIDEAENAVRSYELSLKKEILLYKSPYEQAIENYEKAKSNFIKIGWKEEASRLSDTIRLYSDKKVKDDNLRVIEQAKKEKGKVIEKTEPKLRKVSLTREEKILELERQRLKGVKKHEEVFNLINKAENLVKDYELKLKNGITDIAAPYEMVVDLYLQAKSEFNKIGWNQQAAKLDDTIDFYKKKLYADKKLRAFELEKEKKREEELRKMKVAAKIAKKTEQEVLKKREKEIQLKQESLRIYEQRKQTAFDLMDSAKSELKKNNYDEAITQYERSKAIFDEINWPEGITMVNDTISLIKKKQDKIKRQLEANQRIEEERKKLESQIEEQITKSVELQEAQQELKKKELIEMQKKKQEEHEISVKAFNLLEKGTKLKEKKKFEEAYTNYIKARNLFRDIGWSREVSRINNDLLVILKKEQKQEEKLKAYKEEKVKREKELKLLLEEAEVKRKELEENKKEEKRRLRDNIIKEEIEKANNIVNRLKYNEGIIELKRILDKLGEKEKEKYSKQIYKQIEILDNASQVPLITINDIEEGEDLEKYELSYHALDKAQISLSENRFMRAIAELNEAKFNLESTKIGMKYIPIIDEKIEVYKTNLGIKPTTKEEAPIPSEEKESSLRKTIAERRAERKKRIRELLEE